MITQPRDGAGATGDPYQRPDHANAMTAIRVHIATEELGQPGWYVHAADSLAAFVTGDGSELRIVTEPRQPIALGNATDVTRVPPAARALIEAFLRTAAFRPMTDGVHGPTITPS